MEHLSIYDDILHRYAACESVPAEFRNGEIARRMGVIAEQLLIDNEKFNLTAITDPEEIFYKHILDSAICADLLPSQEDVTLLDVGSGAGFPSLPIAACRENVRVTAMDATAKKCMHMNDTAASAEISNFAAVSGRAEDFSKTKLYREQFDFVTARAVARLPILLELCLPFVKVGGCFIAMKGKTAPEEMEDSRKCLQKLGGKIENSRKYFVPGDENPRYLLTIRKISPTPAAYPRQYAQIAKKPL
jgi:16S rRNA (guanine527-N7)-methyltransferase